MRRDAGEDPVTPFEKIEQARRLLAEAQRELAGALETDRSRRRGQIVQELHRIATMLDGSPGHFSQAGQDRIVDRILGGRRGGVFADIGGYDGVTGSNTLFFEVFRGWSGILVEPAPTQLRKAEAVRRCRCIGAAAGGRAGELDFMEVTEGFTQMSGFLESYDADLLARVRGDPRHREVIHRMPVRPLGEILAEAGLGRIDYLSLDVEGGELEILENFDFGAFDVRVWSIENNTGRPEIPRLMAERGYDLVEFAGVDEIYRKREGA